MRWEDGVTGFGVGVGKVIQSIGTWESSRPATHEPERRAPARLGAKTKSRLAETGLGALLRFRGINREPGPLMDSFPGPKPPDPNLKSVREAAEFDERAKKNNQRGNEEPRGAMHHQNYAPTDEESEQDKHQNGGDKFHATK